ncbi:hypothetical protein ACJJIW_09940 [Microbulbifer sp. JMSA004]|uniref:hypothetical protein n=1 Tax=Microbulbifer sp. JMSA004 TaxID=3243370 RepID=UPI004039E289
MYDKKKWQWICPDTGNIYNLKHTQEFETSYGVKLEKGEPAKDIACRVIFSNHCFTRLRNPEDLDSHVMVRESKRGGNVEERVFCPVRWDFSQQLPEIIRDLTYRNCLIGGSR